MDQANRPYISVVIVLLIGMAMTATTSADTLTVGTGGAFRTLSAAAAAAKDGDIIEIEEGEYRGDVAVWTQDRLTLRGLGAGAHLAAGGEAAEFKATWVIKGDDVVVDNIEFSGSRVPDRNGAGIRLEGTNLTIRNSRFHDNENGVLTGAGEGFVRIEFSTFSYNGSGTGQSHNLYVGSIDELVIRGSYFHHANVGHNIKSRARTTRLLYNRIMDYDDGRSSYLVDLPDGGNGLLVGNVLQQGPATDNSALISYGAESPDSAYGALVLINNTLVNDRHAGTFVKVATPYAGIHLQNNILLGKGEITNRPYRSVANYVDESGVSWFGRANLFVDRRGFDYRLIEDADAIDMGIDPGKSATGEDRRPLLEYRHPTKMIERQTIGALDAGAFEFTAQ